MQPICTHMQRINVCVQPAMHCGLAHHGAAYELVRNAAGHALPAPLRCACALYVMKNWLPLVCGPLLAMDTTPRLLCFSVSTSSSGNLPLGVA